MRDDGRDEWKRQVGTLWRMASEGIDSLREVVVRSSEEGRLRVDLALYQRERRDLLSELGHAVVGLIDAGRLAVPDELMELVGRLRQVEERVRHDSARVHDNAFGAPRGYEPEAAATDDHADDHDENDATASRQKKNE
jgi:hypothetical protein